MKPAILVPKGHLDKKPPYGAECTRCGLCCMATLCKLSMQIFDLPEQAGPCPALEQDGDGYRCGVVADPDRYASKVRLVRFGTERLRKAALGIIGAGQGCDARFNGEPRDPAVVARFDRAINTRDMRNAYRIWGVKP